MVSLLKTELLNKHNIIHSYTGSLINDISIFSDRDQNMVAVVSDNVSVTLPAKIRC
jgi:hypothetical protein